MTGSSGWRTRVMLGMCGLFAAMIACEKTPLLAPTGSTLILTAPSTALSANSSVRVTAHVLEAAGTPPHSGTRVTFTTTLGTLQPAIAETDVNGMASVLFFAGNSNGSAKISASSGAASTGTDGVLTIAIGAGAAGRVTLTANPNIIQTNGGSSVISASVLDINGAALSGVTVSFATSAGALSTSVATTDAGGNASTVLTTTTQATVTATVGVGSGTGTGTGTGTGNGSTAGQASASVTVNVNAAPTVSVTPTTTGTLTAGTPITFAITVQPPANSSAQIRNVSISFGDGTSLDLGAITGSNITQQHVYANSSSVQTYTVRVTAIDTLNASTSAATTVVVQPQPPLSVTFSQSRTVSGTNTAFTFTATVTPNTTTVQTYAWDFGDGSPTEITTSPQTSHLYPTGSGSKQVTLTVTATNGATATTSQFVVP